MLQIVPIFQIKVAYQITVSFHQIFKKNLRKKKKSSISIESKWSNWSNKNNFW